MSDVRTMPKQCMLDWLKWYSLHLWRETILNYTLFYLFECHTARHIVKGTRLFRRFRSSYFWCGCNSSFFLLFSFSIQLAPMCLMV